MLASGVMKGYILLPSPLWKVGVSYTHFKNHIDKYVLSTWQDYWNCAVANMLYWLYSVNSVLKTLLGRVMYRGWSIARRENCPEIKKWNYLEMNVLNNLDLVCFVVCFLLLLLLVYVLFLFCYIINVTNMKMSSTTCFSHLLMLIFFNCLCISKLAWKLWFLKKICWEWIDFDWVL